MIEERLNAVESRMAHLENYLNQLNDIVLENGHLLKAIKKEQSALKEQISDVSSHLPGPEAVKPPHY